MILLAAIALVATAPVKGNDGYYIERITHRSLQTNVTVITYPTIEELRTSAPIEMQKTNRLRAWTRFVPGRCTIHIVDPVVAYQPHFLGHELAHCLYGSWHPSQPKK